MLCWFNVKCVIHISIFRYNIYMQIQYLCLKNHFTSEPLNWLTSRCSVWCVIHVCGVYGWYVFVYDDLVKRVQYWIDLPLLTRTTWLQACRASGTRWTTSAARSPTWTSRSPFRSGGGPSITSSTWSSHVFLSLPWLSWGSPSPLTRGRSSHSVSHQPFVSHFSIFSDFNIAFDMVLKIVGLGERGQFMFNPLLYEYLVITRQ